MVCLEELGLIAERDKQAAGPLKQQTVDAVLTADGAVLFAGGGMLGRAAGPRSRLG